MTIVQRLILIVLLASIPIGVLQFVSVRQKENEERAEITQVALRTAHRASAEQRRVVEGAKQLLSALSQLPAVRENDVNRCTVILRRLQPQFEIYTAIGVANPEGRIWCSSTRSGTLIADRPYFKQAIETRQFTTGGYIIGRVMGTPTLNFSLPFEDRQGRLLGVLVAGLDLNRLAADVGRAQLPSDSKLVIVGPDQRVLVHLPDGTHVGNLLPRRFDALFNASQAGVRRVGWIDGSDRIVASVPPAAERGMPFLIAIGMDRAAASRAVERMEHRSFAVLLGVVTAALLLAWWFAMHYVRRPVQGLARAVAAWRDGDDTVRVGRIDPGSEFDELGLAFDAMADAVEEREHRLRDALESTTDSVVTISPDWRVTFLNGRAQVRLGGAEPLGKDLWESFPEFAVQPVAAELRAAMEQRQPVTAIFQVERLVGYFELHAFPASDGGLTLFLRDVTAQRQAQEDLRVLALYDPLTGLPNRTHAMQVATQKSSDGSLSSMILVDLDGFKYVNDRLGHSAGDAMLRQVAGRLSSCIGDNGMVARFGGDEFLALLFDRSEIESIDAGRAILGCLALKPFDVQGRTHRVTASCGLVLTDLAGVAGTDGMLADADLALYKAKKAGGGTCRIYTRAEREAHEMRQQLEDEIARAVIVGEFELHFQPQVCFDDGAVTGAEALLRWRHPQRGLLVPADFMEVLEGSRHARETGAWIIDDACHQVACWRRMGFELRISVNLFAEQLRSGDLCDYVQRTLEKHDLPPEALEMEITENIGLEADDTSKAVLSQLRSLGITLAFDDFGTGFASFKSLKDFEVDRLKIDRGFVTQLASNAHDKAIVEAVLALARTLGLGVVAEGVETLDQEEYLKSRGCQEAQGYRYGKPMPADAFTTYLLRTQLSDNR